MNEQAISAMMRLLSHYNDIRPLTRPQHEVKEAAFSRCALEEALTQVWDHPWTLASDTIERFAFRMEAYEAEAVTDDQEKIFSVAAEFAWALYEKVKDLER